MKKFPVLLLVLYVTLFILFAIHPYNRSIWVNENLPVVITVLFLIFSYKRFSFSSTSYIIIFLGCMLQTIGGHYTFDLVPFDWFDNFFGFNRNMYDRVGHFALGLFAYPLAEFIKREKFVTRRWLVYLIPIIALFAVASIYEIIEWVYPLYAPKANAAAFLGSQGDVWDAQKDMLANGLGAIIAILGFWLQKKIKKV